MTQAEMPSDIASQLIVLLGETSARAQASHAKEEYALSQIIASLKFVNHTVDAWDNSSQQEEESSQFHVYEPDLSAVSKSIDAVLDESRLVRGSSKRTAANANKGVTSTFENAVTHITPRKSKAAEQKKTLERFSQALHMRPTKTVSTDHGEHHPSFSAAHEMLLRWMESRKVGWSNTHAEQRPFHIVAKLKHEKSAERSNAARKFLDSLWTIHGSPADSETKVEDAAAPGARSLQRNVEELQALCKLVNLRHLHSELLYPYMTISNAYELQSGDHLVSNEEESAANDNGSWLPARVCWTVLGTQVNGIMMEHEMQAVSTLYSNLQQPLTTMRLMHSIHTNIFYCHLQSVLAQCFLLRLSSQSSRRNEYSENNGVVKYGITRIQKAEIQAKKANVLSSSSVYMCFRLAHCLVCNNGKALFSVARRVDIT